LFGLAVGDAVGTTLEFRPPGSFTPIHDMIWGGPFNLKPGEWTDDTSMALCLAESMIEKGTFDPVDQLQRYARWYREGYLSSNGRCFDIGNTVRRALQTFDKTGKPYCGPTDPRSPGNGSIMRLAPGGGRTGTVVGCYLARHGMAKAKERVAKIKELRRTDATA